MSSASSLATFKSIRAWRLQALNWILRGQFPFWVLAYIAGVWNAIQTYRENPQATANTPFLFALAITLFTLALAVLTLITFCQKLAYSLRAFTLLGIYYALSVLLFAISALSGDARGFLFAFMVIAVLLLDFRYSLFALALALLTYALMGWLNVSGILRIAAEHGYNATDPSAWISGGIVLGTLAVSASLGIHYLLRAFVLNLHQMRQALENEKRASAALRLLSNVNQLIVREHHPIPLLERTCQIILENGYSRAAVALLEDDGTSLTTVTDTHPSELLPEIALQAVQARHAVAAPSALAMPIFRPQRDYGVLVIARVSAQPEFDSAEISLFHELADDLAYALENLTAETQRRALAEAAEPLLTARDESEFWQAALQAVKSILRANRAAVYLYHYGTDRLTCPYAEGLSQAYIDEVNRRFRDLPGSRILLDPKPVTVNDTESDPAAASLRPFLQREGIRAYAVFSLFSAQKLLGAFTAYRNAPLPFSQADLEAGQTLAHLVAAALQNARLFAETRAKAAEQAALFIAAQEFSASLLNPQALLETLAKHLCQSLDATSVYVISLDKTKETMTVLAEYWSEAAAPAERKSDLGRVYPVSDFPHVTQAMLAGKPLILQADEADLSEAERREYTDYLAHSKLFVPLLAQGELVGYTEIWESRRKREFTQHEIHLAQAIASYAASVIRAANLFAELEQREAYFRALIENAPDGIAILNRDGTFRYLSPAVETILGYRAEELIGQSPFDHIHPDDLEYMQEAFADGIKTVHIETAKKVMRVEYRFRSRSGEWRHLEAVAHNRLLDTAVNGIVVNYRDMTERKQAEERLAQAYDSTLEGWARALELRDKDTEGHTRRVTELAVKLARAMRLPEEQITHLRRGAILHDIGKISVPDKILHKTAPLTEEEQTIIRQHPLHAYKMLSPIEHLRPALDIPYCHHEKWDGTGYPRGLKGEEIPLAARIFAVADVYDALTSDRPYHPAWDEEKVIRYIAEQSGKYFDPQVVEIFLSLMTQDSER